MTVYGVYINCSEAPFIDQILARVKHYETRKKNMLRDLVGRRVFLISTGTGAPTIEGLATISGAQLVPYSDARKRAHAKITGTPYDIQPGGAKWFYTLSDVQRLPHPLPVPAARKNHGRSWTTWEE